MKKIIVSTLCAFTVLGMSGLPVYASEPIEASGIQKVYVEPEDWGPVVTKSVMKLDHSIKTGSIGDEENEFSVEETKNVLQLPAWEVGMATSQRTVLKAYTSDELGNKVNNDSPYITLEMYVSPTVTGEGAAFVYNGYNEWCNPYESKVTLNGTLETTDNQVVNSINVNEKIDLEGDGRICPVTEKFKASTFSSSDGKVLPYASYTPQEDNKKNALVVWLHGAGEGGTNPEIAYLGNKVTSLISDEFQNNFGGAYVLVPQCPEGYGWPVDVDGNYTSGATPSRWRQSLFELIDTYVKDHPDIDANRIIIGGCSNGGNMVYDLVLSHMGYFAAAFPMCHEFDINTCTDEQLNYLKTFPVWSTYTLGDSSSFKGSIPIVNKMKEIGATNFHYSEFKNASDVTGRFYGSQEDPTVLDTTGTSTTPLQYDGHWAWTLFFENQCQEGDLNAWKWLSMQTKEVKIEETPKEDVKTEAPTENKKKENTKKETPKENKVVKTGDPMSVMTYIVSMLSSMMICFVFLKKKFYR